MKIGIAGIGLIGGSLAIQIRKTIEKLGQAGSFDPTEKKN